MITRAYTGAVTGLCQQVAGTNAAICQSLQGGTLRFTPNNIRKGGVGGRVHTRKGGGLWSIDWTCVAPDKTYLGFWFPAGIGVAVANFPTLFCEADDGTVALEVLLGGGQPNSVKATCAEGPDAEVEWTFSAIFTDATIVSTPTKSAVYSSHKGHTGNECSVTFGTATKLGVLSFELGLEFGAKALWSRDGKAAGVRTIADGVLITKYEPTFRVTTAQEGTTSTLEGDDWTAEDIVLALDNGTAGENLTFTLSGFVPEEWQMPIESEKETAFGHAFVPGSGDMFGRIALT